MPIELICHNHFYLITYAHFSFEICFSVKLTFKSFTSENSLKIKNNSMTSRDEQSDTFLSSDAVNEEFFIDIIEKKLKIARDKFKLRLVLITPATGKNENFVCVVYRAKIKILLLDSNEIITTSVIIKALLSLMQEFKEFSVFPRERFTYENIITSFEKIWSDVGEDIQFAPRCLRFDTDPYEMFVMEDLQAMGYKMLDRKIGANKEQTNCLISKLAKFHAASAIRYRKVFFLFSFFGYLIFCYHN